jgi:hypothetical protein
MYQSGNSSDKAQGDDSKRLTMSMTADSSCATQPRGGCPARRPPCCRAGHNWGTRSCPRTCSLTSWTPRHLDHLSRTAQMKAARLDPWPRPDPRFQTWPRSPPAPSRSSPSSHSASSSSEQTAQRSTFSLSRPKPIVEAVHSRGVHDCWIRFGKGCTTGSCERGVRYGQGGDAEGRKGCATQTRVPRSWAESSEETQAVPSLTRTPPSIPIGFRSSYCAMRRRRSIVQEGGEEMGSAATLTSSILRRHRSTRWATVHHPSSRRKPSTYRYSSRSVHRLDKGKRPAVSVQGHGRASKLSDQALTSTHARVQQCVDYK